MRTIMALAMTLAALAIVPAAQATVPVTSLTGDFAATNPSVALGPDGVTFGPYANGGCDEGGVNCSVGSLLYSGANGLTLADISDLQWTEIHNSSDDAGIASPYLRIFFDDDADGNDDHVLIFDPTECATVVPEENVANHYDVVAGTPNGELRFDDDPCGPAPDDLTWGEAVIAHGGHIISGIYITTGATAGKDLSALVPDLTVNGTTFDFGAPEAGPSGPSGPAGTSGTVTLVTEPTIINRTVLVPGTSAKCRGDELRTIHALRRKGETFLSARANAMWLRGKRLPVHGRAITVDLRGKPEANYNVVIHARYMRASGIAHTVRSERHISVVCS